MFVSSRQASLSKILGHSSPCTRMTERHRRVARAPFMTEQRDKRLRIDDPGARGVRLREVDEIF